MSGSRRAVQIVRSLLDGTAEPAQVASQKALAEHNQRVMKAKVKPAPASKPKPQPQALQAANKNAEEHAAWRIRKWQRLAGGQ